MFLWSHVYTVRQFVSISEVFLIWLYFVLFTSDSISLAIDQFILLKKPKQK